MDTFPDGSEKLHVAGGIDYYFYTPNFWDLKDMPDFSIARGRFDHWLMGYAYTYGNGNVVDLTNEWIPYHPDPIHRVDGDFANLFNSGEDVKKAYQIFRNNYYFAIAKLHTDQNILWLHGEQEILFPESESIKVGINNKFSVLPFSDLINLNITGAEWNLENENIEFGQSKTLRNIARNEKINISVSDGKFCLIIYS